MSDMIIGGLCLGFTAFILVALALFFLVRTRSFIGRSRQTQGTITQMVYDSSTEGGGYLPIFRFRTLEGQEVEAKSDLATNPPQFKVGQVIDVLYDPGNPSKARIKKWFNLYYVPTLLGFLGLLLGCIGIAFIAFAGFDAFK
jgi:hypothetical protein